MPDHRWNSSGSAYSTREWLDNHHAIKSRLRADLVSKLPINPGDRVVDLGCATGNWTMLLADRVGIRGSILGVDIDDDAIALAKQRQAHHVLYKQIDFRLGSLEEVNFPPKSVDVFVIFNTLSYLRDPLSLLRRIEPSLHSGGRLLVKDTDLQSDFFWPVAFETYSNVMASVMSGPGTLVEKNYDPFFARKLPSLLRELASLKITTMSQSFSFALPLAPEEREYVRANAAMISSIAAANGAIDAADAWFSLFDEANPQSIFEHPDFLYSMNEFIFQGVVT